MTNREYLNTLSTMDFALTIDDIMFQSLRNFLLLKSSKLEIDKAKLLQLKVEAENHGFTDLDNLGLFNFYKWLEEEYCESN